MSALDLATLTLAKGCHAYRSDGLCLMEAVAWMAGEPHTDMPACTSLVLGAFGRSLNDVLPDDKRQQLIPLVPRFIGTAGDGLDERRGYLALDWLTRTYLPAWLELAGLTVHGATLKGSEPVTSMEAARKIGAKVRAAGDAARVAAGVAAWDAAWVAAGAAAGAAARDAARDAAGDAAGAVARDAARDAAWVAAGVAARAAARVAAGDAARVAAWDAAWEVLSPVVALLQDSAVALLADMISPPGERTP
jgi:hypothetical protein